MIIKNLVLEALTRTDILSKLLNSKDLPVRSSFQLGKLVKLLSDAIKDYTDAKQKLLEKYAERDEAGKLKVENNQYRVPPENILQFNSDLTELLEIDIDLPMDKVKINLDNIPTGLISPVDFPFLENFIEFEE